MNRITTIAILSAVGFVVLALFNNVHAWPLIFPLIGGIVAMVFRNNNNTDTRYSSVAKAGFYASILVLISCAFIFYFLLKDAITQKASDIGLDGAGGRLELTLIIALILGVVFFLTFLLGTGIGAIFSKKKH